MKHLIRKWIGLYEAANAIEEYELRLQVLEKDMREMQQMGLNHLLYHAEREK